MKTDNALIDLAIAELRSHIQILNKLALANNKSDRYSAFDNYASDTELAITLLKHKCDPSVIIPKDDINVANVLLPIKSILSTYDRSINKKKNNSRDSIGRIKKIKDSLEYAVTIIESYQ